MYKIMLVDDEGIVTDALTFIIEKNFNELCHIQTAKTGRGAIELAEVFHPDIVFMDMHMPGINGIEAMEEIQSRNNAVVFIVLSAYDKFNYAKQAIDLGVLEYLMKPTNSTKVIEVLRKAMKVIDEKRHKISQDLEIKEKLKTVVPVLEQGFIYTLLFQESAIEEVKNYCRLLDIKKEYGYIMILEYGDDDKEGNLTNPVGASVKTQQIYGELRGIIKDFWNVVIGAPMANYIAMYLPYEGSELIYNERIQIIESARLLVRKLAKEFGMSYKIGIGSLTEIEEIHSSYKEAVAALRGSKGRVAHIEDLPSTHKYEDNYPIQTEKALFSAIKRGNIEVAREYAGHFFDWMIKDKETEVEVIQLKVLEFILWAEHLAYENSGMVYRFQNQRNDYLDKVTGQASYADLRQWFLGKIGEAAKNITIKEEKQTSGLVEQAKCYIKDNFSKDISLDEVSKEVNISPYYFSKLFKEETGEKFVEYVTNVRIKYAKELLKTPTCSIKEACIESGYSDPNYFSRIFKKCTGVTPSEYRERRELDEI